MIDGATSGRVTTWSVLRSPRGLTREVLAGMVTTLALIPEVISFSVIAGVSPEVSLISSVVLATTMSILGGRSGSVSAAAGSVALVAGPLVKAHGVQYLLPAVVLAGVLQILFGAGGLARLMRFVPRSVMIGFVNALGILIFTAQLQHVIGVPLAVYPLIVIVIVIVLFLPRFTKAIPAPLIAIIAVTTIAFFLKLGVPTVGGTGPAPGAFPGINELQVPLDFATFGVIWPTAVSIALVGLMESLLTAKLVDDITDTPSHKGRESWALGVANILAGFYGGIAGCAMIGQTVVNVKLGGARTRISTMVAGLFLLLLVTSLNHVLALVPMAGLAAVMMIVAIRTVNWQSVRPATLRRMPLSETVVMIVTITAVVITSNLAVGIGAGVVTAMVLFARRLAHANRVERILDDSGDHVRYRVFGPLFFGSSHDFAERFSYVEDPPDVVIDFGQSQIWDASTVAVLDTIKSKYSVRGTTVRFEGLDRRSVTFNKRLSGYLNG